MLCPEVWNFPPPKAVTTTKHNLDLEKVQEIVNMNCFYKSVVITVPDELHIPSLIEEVVADCDYYKITNCPLSVFIENKFVENFVNNGRIYCLSANRDCIVDTCAAITPDGIMTLHLPDFTFQCLGLEGVERPHNFYEIKIDLKDNMKLKKVKPILTKLETFDFFIYWEPHDEEVCPSSIAKYLYDQNLQVSAVSQEIENISPKINEIPGADAEPSELCEWIGMLALGCDLTPEYEYVSSYSPPESEKPIVSSRINLMVLKGFFTPEILKELCAKIATFVNIKKSDNYWASLSIQSHTDCLWRWNPSSSSVFQSHDSSTTVIFTKDSNTLYSIGEIKFS